MVGLLDNESLRPPKLESKKIVHPQLFPTDLKKKFRIESEVTNNEIFIRYQAYDLEYYRPITLTILKELSKIYLQKIIEALDTLVQINHPNILPILDHNHVEDGKRYYWITPRVVPIYWDDIIKQSCSESEHLEFIIGLFIDLFSGLKAAHKHNVIHGMISPNTIFLYNDRFCFSDFSFPISLNTAVTIYTAPEIVDGKGIDVSTDLYSIGILFRELISQNFTNYYQNPPDQSKKSIKVDIKISKNIIFPHLQEYIHQLTKSNPDERFESIEAALEAFEKAVNLEKVVLLGKIPSEIDILDRIKKEPLDSQIDIKSELMPVLSKTIREINRLAFKDVVILHINHCLEDVFIFNQLLASIAYDLIFVTVPYGSQQVSTSVPYPVYHAFDKQGEFELYQNEEPLEQISSDFNNAMDILISRALKGEIARYVSEGKKILIIEDGGYHYNILHGLDTNELKLKQAVIGVVEQTTSGVIRCANSFRTTGASYPMLTAARSNVKIRYEAYFIGRRVVDELNYLLYEFNDFLSFHNVAVIGYGIIGRNVAACLNGMNCQISVIDIDKETSSLAMKEGYSVYDTLPVDFFEGTTIIIGSSGESSFTYLTLYNFLESGSSKMYLASASSKRIEFSKLIGFFEGSYETRKNIIKLYPDFEKINDIQIEYNKIGLAYHFNYCNKNKSIILVARGFPVNFYRPGSISLTYTMIDPVYAEMVLLAQHLVLYSSELKKELYLLGSSNIPYFNINEEEVISTWIESNKLSAIKKNADVWSNFRVHPLEEKLRVRCIMNTE